MFKLTIETNSAAFEDDCPDEIGRILRDLADKIENTCRPGALGEYSGGVRDLNGNTTGHWSLKQNT